MSIEKCIWKKYKTKTFQSASCENDFWDLYFFRTKAPNELTRPWEKVKAELEIELDRLNFDMEKELNKYVIFDTSSYYELEQEEKKEVVSHGNAIKLLLTAFDMLVKLNETEAAIEVENTITRLENNSY